jgi:hypothetical protein
MGALLAILFAGCVNIDYQQVVDRDGGSVLTEKIDLSALIAMSQQYGSNESDFSTICINITKGQSSIDCRYDDGIITVKKSLKASDGQYTFTKSSELPYTVYTLEVRKLPNIVDTKDLEGSGTAGDTSVDFKSTQAKTAAATLKTAGAGMTYNVSMPGDIYSAEHGEIKGGQAHFDVLELMSNGDYIVVKSHELDLVVVGAAVLALLVVAGAAAFLVLKRK